MDPPNKTVVPAWVFPYICRMQVPDYTEILVDSSRNMADMVVSQVGRNASEMDRLYHLAIERNDQIAMRAARAFDLVDEKYPGMANPFLDSIRKNISSIRHQSVIRCFLRTLMRHPLPEDDEELGLFYQLMLDMMMDRKLPVALRYYGMTLAFQTACSFPDLRFELISLYDEVAREPLKGLAGRAVYNKKLLIKKFGAE